MTDEFVSASATVTANDSIYDLEDTHSADEPRVRRLKAPHAIHPVYMRVSRNPKIVEMLTHLWGSLRFDTGKLNMKSAGYGAPIEWHQDWAFYPHTRLRIAARARAKVSSLSRSGAIKSNAPSGHRQSGAVARSHARVLCRRRPLDARLL